MPPFSTDPPYLKRAVQFMLRDQMQRIRTTDQRYGLADLAYGLYGGSMAPPGYIYPLELARTRAKVGFFAGERGYHDDPLLEYGRVQLTRGDIFEFEQRIDPGTVNRAFHPLQTMGITTIRHNGAILGECRVTGYGKMLGFPHEKEWALSLNGKPFGTVWRKESFLDRFWIARPNETQLPLLVSHHGLFFEQFYQIWRALTLQFLYAPPRPNPDLIIPRRVRPRLTGEEVPFYFAVSLLFRHFYQGYSRRG